MPLWAMPHACSPNSCARCAHGSPAAVSTPHPLAPRRRATVPASRSALQGWSGGGPRPRSTAASPTAQAHVPRTTPAHTAGRRLAPRGLCTSCARLMPRGDRWSVSRPPPTHASLRRARGTGSSAQRACLCAAAAHARMRSSRRCLLAATARAVRRRLASCASAWAASAHMPQPGGPRIAQPWGSTGRCGAISHSARSGHTSNQPDAER
jgi:hypothetical protein